MSKQTTHEPGVLFDSAAYAGLGRRAVGMAIDLLVIWLAWILIAITWYWVIRRGEEPVAEATLTWLGFSYIYLAILKATPIRTVGYWLTGVKIVNFRGQRPSFFRTTLRFLLWIVGPINLVLDWLWIGSDHHKQSLRDKFAGTYVIRTNATPIGSSPRKTAYYSLAGLTLMFVEIQTQNASA
ncbi:MAG: RDD family protein [Planctomycetaceae bacterium]